MILDVINRGQTTIVEEFLIVLVSMKITSTHLSRSTRRPPRSLRAQPWRDFEIASEPAHGWAKGVRPQIVNFIFAACTWMHSRKVEHTILSSLSTLDITIGADGIDSTVCSLCGAQGHSFQQLGGSHSVAKFRKHEQQLAQHVPNPLKSHQLEANPFVGLPVALIGGALSCWLYVDMQWRLSPAPREPADRAAAPVLQV